jgi:hypothetical protein
LVGLGLVLLLTAYVATHVSRRAMNQAANNMEMAAA